MPKKQQSEMPLRGEGVERKSIMEIERAADEYADVRDERMRFTELETEAQAKLVAAMHKHKLTKYRYDGKTVEVEAKEKVKVKRDKRNEE